MDAADKRMLEREALRNMIQQWNANRLDLFELSEPNENLEFHGVMRFYFQDSGQKIATKCIRVASDATVSDVIETLIEKFRPDMRMLSLGSYSLWETHGPDDERRLESHEKPLLVQLNWHADDREGRFLLKCLTNTEVPLSSANEKSDQNFKRKLSKREKKELKKKEKLSRMKSDAKDDKAVAEKLYTELPETSFTRSISNPEAVMHRRRQQKLERKLQQFRSKDGGPDTGGTLKIYGSSLSPDVPYKTLLLSVGDTAASVAREMLDKYGLSRHDPHQFCIVQVDCTDNSEYILEDDECPLAIVMTHPHRSSIMFHVRRRPADAQPRRRKKKTGASLASANARHGSEAFLVEVTPDGTQLENGRRVRVTDVVEVGSGNGSALQLYGPSIQSRHCVVAAADSGGYTVTPLHADAHVYVGGRRITHSQRLQHGSLLKFGRVSTFRFVDPSQENLINRNLAQSQHYGSGSIYDRSQTSPGDNTSGAMSPTSMTSHQPEDPNANEEYPRTMSPISQDTYGYREGNETAPYNNNTLKLDNESLMMSQHLNESKDDYIREEPTGSVYNDHDQNSTANKTVNSQYKDNYETTFDLDGNVETKSICSAKSGGSGHDSRMSATASATRTGQEAILPAVLEFPEAGQAQFLAAVISRLDPHAPAFKLAPVYTLYLCARYRASTHYRPELSPMDRAQKLTAFLHHVATLIHTTVQERCTDSAAQAFWMANASEFLHFLNYDRHINSFSAEAQELLPQTIQNAFSNLVTCFQEELSRALSMLNNPSVADATEATAPTLQALAAAMVLLRRCRVNAALTIQLFSHLFHYINAVCFNKLVAPGGLISARWGAQLAARLSLLAAWAERQGLELAADCHLARTRQAARLIQGTYRTVEEVQAALSACFKLNSWQVSALLVRHPRPLRDAAAAHAAQLADELCRAQTKEIRLEESEWLGAALLIPSDGFSAEVVRGVPPGLVEFIAPLQRGGLCRLAHQPHAVGVWTVYMVGYGAQSRRATDPRVQIIQLHKNCNGMGLSIVAAKGSGQSKLGIYIKSVVPGGAAAADGRLAAGDQLLSVDSHSLVGITQEKAAEYLVRTGPTVTLEVAKQGAVHHGLATLLSQPGQNQRQDEQLQYEDRARRNNIKPVSPRTELATAGFPQPCHDRCHLRRDESTESSSDDSEDFQPLYRGSIPRSIVSLDRENNKLHDDISPDTRGGSLELKGNPPAPLRPVFTFTCEDFDEQQAKCYQGCHVPMQPPCIPDPPLNYDLSSESGDTICIPPQMRSINTKLTLDLFNALDSENECYRRCTGVEECVSACECCRTPQPDAPQIPYIDEPSFEPVIFESDRANSRVSTPKIRRILPSLSLDLPDDKKPETVDAECQTPSTPVDNKVLPTSNNNNPATRKLEMTLNVRKDTDKFQNIHCRLKRTLFNMSKSTSKSEETDAPSTYSTSESVDDSMKCKRALHKSIPHTPLNVGAKQVLDSVDRKSWKSPDEYRPAFGKVKALAKHFNDINLTYCVKNYKRNCQSSPNLSVRDDKTITSKENLPSSVSLADIQYESNKSTSETKGVKMSDDEVKSILIQLEDWSKFGSRGSEDTLAQGNEFELPNLPSEETENSLIFSEIIDKKPKVITLENIKLKSNQSSVNSELVISPTSKESSNKSLSLQVPRVVAMIPHKNACSLLDVSISREESRRESYATVVQSCPNISAGSVRGRFACSASSSHYSCPALGKTPQSPGSTGALRRASERDLPSRLAAEPVKPSKSTPALHHVSPPQQPTMVPAAAGTGSVTGGGTAPGTVAPGWAHKSRSSHNLSAPQDAFYQNLATVHSQQDRWSTLRSSTNSNRPQSTHFSGAAQTEPAPLSPRPSQYQELNQANMTLRAVKLAEMSEEVTRRQQQQQQMQNQIIQQKPILPHPNLNPPLQNQQLNQSLQQLNQSHLLNQKLNHSQQHLNQSHQQLNLSHQMHGQMNQQLMSPGQQLMSPTQQQMGQNQQLMSPTQQIMSPAQQQMGQNQQLMSPVQQQMNQSQQLMSTQQGQQLMSPTQQQMNQGHQMHVHYQQQVPAGMHQGNMLNTTMQMHHNNMLPQSSPHQQTYNNNQMPPSQRYDWPQGAPPSPQRSQPPVAPKPQSMRRPESEVEELHQQMQNQSMMQPDDDRMSELVGAGGGPLSAWQREERDKLLEARRRQARVRRDAVIAQLLSLGSGRSPAQSQQLRALQLERDFERRATQEQEDSNTTETSPEQQCDSPSPPHAPGHPAPQATGPHAPGLLPPKSILKASPRPDFAPNHHHNTNGYAHEPAEERAPELPPSGALSPPPPPERGSSFAVMAGRRPDVHLPTHVNTNQQQPSSAPQSPVSACRDKRVSFHERAGASPPPPGGSPAPPAPPNTSPPPLDHQPVHREDPDRFIEEASHMLLDPPSPSPATTPTSATTLPPHTPGVIGAQEVYRDPRTRRLAEQQARSLAPAIPEQLSFKEKMKMFALESGEHSTPKDKVKISRAQRDIDAVH